MMDAKLKVVEIVNSDGLVVAGGVWGLVSIGEIVKELVNAELNCSDEFWKTRTLTIRFKEEEIK